MTDLHNHDGGTREPRDGRRTAIGGARTARLTSWALFGMAALSQACSDGVTVYRTPPNAGDSEPGSADDPPTAIDANGGTDVPGSGSAVAGAVSGVVGDPSSSSGSGSPAGLGDDDPAEWSPPVLRGAVTLPDADLARQALALMGSAAVGAEGSCRNCHSLGRPTLTRWQTLTDAFRSACLGSTELSDVAAVDAKVDCFRAHAAPEPTLSAASFGIYAAAAHLPWFEFVFEHTSDSGDDGPERHAQFVRNVGMPRAGTPLVQTEFDVVAEWFARGLPELFELVPEEDGGACTDALDPSLRTHVESMRAAGWKAKNEQVPLLMFGCEDGDQTADCLAQVPLAADTDFGADWDVPGGATIHILHDNTGFPSNYWSRSSADGRYFASGLRDGGDATFTGQIIDLENDGVIEAGFAYDPTFFPDNSGFMLQRSRYSESVGPTDGSPSPDDTAIVCDQSVLGGNPEQLTGDEPECTELSGQIGLYQQLAKSIDGDDYWVVYGSFDEDNGGFSPVYDNPSAAFERASTTTLVPLINQGGTFAAGEPSKVATPLAGDPMLSPSGRLLVTRVKGREYSVEIGGSTVVKAEQSGYALHLVHTAQNGGALTASLSDVGRICLSGGKAVVSYDERWMVLHHYVVPSDASELGFSGPDDPGFADYQELGASNLYLVDLLDGSSRAITNMEPGQYALFPHFRSDGWIYFVVRTLTGEEYFAATNAAVLLENAN